MVKDVHITIIGDEKTVRLHINDPAACSTVEGLNEVDGAFLADLENFASGVLDGNADATVLPAPSEEQEEGGTEAVA
jgi:hypothetical protein